ncbi:hypothetical protein DPMN_069011, partial [Dreissena polymorpha]
VKHKNIKGNIIRTNVLTKFNKSEQHFHEDWTVHVTLRVKNSLLPGGHVFQPTGTIYQLVHDIIGTNLLTKFHEESDDICGLQTIFGKAPPPGGHVFQQPRTIFELIQYIIRSTVLSKFHDDWTIYVTFRVLTSLIGKNAPPSDGLIIKTNRLTKFHEYRTINVSSRVLTRSDNIIVASRVITRKNAPPQVEETNFQGSSANSVGDNSVQDGQIDRRRR